VAIINEAIALSKSPLNTTNVAPFFSTAFDEEDFSIAPVPF
jgi:hypothetical protein